jgi:hypothetical protein
VFSRRRHPDRRHGTPGRHPTREGPASVRSRSADSIIRTAEFGRSASQRAKSLKRCGHQTAAACRFERDRKRAPRTCRLGVRLIRPLPPSRRPVRDDFMPCLPRRLDDRVRPPDEPWLRARIEESTKAQLQADAYAPDKTSAAGVSGVNVTRVARLVRRGGSDTVSSSP